MTKTATKCALNEHIWMHDTLNRWKNAGGKPENAP